MNELTVIDNQTIQDKIYTIRNVQVMVDRDLALLYGVETRRLNEQVKRNIERFPEEFMFQMTNDELENWKSQIATSNKEIMGLRKLPFVFTEQGVAMLSAVLRSETAIKVSIQIMQAFVEMRKNIHNNLSLLQLSTDFEQFKLNTTQQFAKIFNVLENNKETP